MARPVRLAVRILGFLYGVLALLGATALALVMGTVLVLPFAPLPRGRRERYTVPPASVWARWVVRYIVWARDEVVGAAPPPGRGAIVLCNHRSWLDPVLLIAHTRSNGLSKSQIGWIPVLGQLGWLTGAVFFDRRDPRDRDRARREVLHLVRAGHRVQVFPEGTRTRTGELSERVYLTLAMDAFHEGLPVLCCAVWRTERAVPAVDAAAWPFQRVWLAIGPALEPRDHPDARTFAAACWDEVKAQLAGLQEREARSGTRTRTP